MKYYTFDQVSCAKWVLATRHKLNHGPDVIAWAKAVRKWFSTYLKVISLFNEFLNDRQLSVSGIWQCIRGFRSLNDIYSLLHKMLRKVARLHKVDNGPSKWQRKRYSKADRVRLASEGPDVINVNPKTNKHERRSQCSRIADALQSNYSRK